MRNKGFIFYTISLLLVLFIDSCTPEPPLDTIGTTRNPNGSNNKKPVANAGPDQHITLPTARVTLDGSGSYDSLGSPLAFTWRLLNGPSICQVGQSNNQTAIAYDLIEGIYNFELSVANISFASFDTIKVTVTRPAYCQANRNEIVVQLNFLGTLPNSTPIPGIIAAGNKLIIPQGWDNINNWDFINHISNKISIYDISSKTWLSDALSVARTGVAIVAAGNKVFFGGGCNFDYTNGERYTPVSVVDIYDISTNTWSVTNLSEARGFCKAVVAGNKIFFAGGLKASNSLSDKVDIYDLQTNSWTATTLPGGARAVEAAISAQNKIMFCAGSTVYDNITGFGNTFDRPTNKIDIYDNNTGQWSSDSMQSVKSQFSVVSLDDKCYMAGGYDNTNQSTTFDVEIHNINTGEVSNSCLFQPYVFTFFSNSNAAVKDNNLIFLTTWKENRNKFDIYNIQTGTWYIGKLQTDITSTYGDAAITSINNEVYIVFDNKLYKMNF